MNNATPLCAAGQDTSTEIVGNASEERGKAVRERDGGQASKGEGEARKACDGGAGSLDTCAHTARGAHKFVD